MKNFKTQVAFQLEKDMFTKLCQILPEHSEHRRKMDFMENYKNPIFCEIFYNLYDYLKENEEIISKMILPVAVFKADFEIIDELQESDD